MMSDAAKDRIFWALELSTKVKNSLEYIWKPVVCTSRSVSNYTRRKNNRWRLVKSAHTLWFTRRGHSLHVSCQRTADDSADVCTHLRVSSENAVCAWPDHVVSRSPASSVSSSSSSSSPSSSSPSPSTPSLRRCRPATCLLHPPLPHPSPRRRRPLREVTEASLPETSGQSNCQQIRFTCLSKELNKLKLRFNSALKLCDITESKKARVLIAVDARVSRA